MLATDLWNTYQNHRRFHALLKTYDQLSEMILHTVRIDVRCRVAHYLDLAMRHVKPNIFYTLDGRP